MFGQQLPISVLQATLRMHAGPINTEAGMKVSGPGRVSTPSLKKTKGKSKAGRAGFADQLSRADSPAAAAVSGGAPVAAVNALLGLQEVPDATSGRSRGVAHAAFLLDQLEEIRRGLLLGSIPESKLKALAAAIGEKREDFQDPELAGILDDIELRARVELAKLGSS